MKIAIGPSSFAAEDEKPLQMLRNAEIEIVANPYSRRLKEDEIIAHLKDVDGLIAGLEPLNRRVLSSATKLKAIARVGIGMDNIDFNAAEEQGIKISNTPDGPTQAVAELTVACMIALCRKLPQMNKYMHQGEWNKLIGTGLQGATVLIIGYGRIGQAVGRMLQPFSPRLLLCDPVINESQLNYKEELVSLDEGLYRAQVVTLHAAGKKVILDSSAFKKMNQGAILLNSARAELVDQEALTEALVSGKLGGAWFDVFWHEPYQGDLRLLDNIMLTPHIGTYTAQCRLCMETEAVKNILRDLGLTQSNF